MASGRVAEDAKDAHGSWLLRVASIGGRRQASRRAKAQGAATNLVESAGHVAAIRGMSVKPLIYMAGPGQAQSRTRQQNGLSSHGQSAEPGQPARRAAPDRRAAPPERAGKSARRSGRGRCRTMARSCWAFWLPGGTPRVSITASSSRAGRARPASTGLDPGPPVRKKTAGHSPGRRVGGQQPGAPGGAAPPYPAPQEPGPGAQRRQGQPQVGHEAALHIAQQAHEGIGPPRGYRMRRSTREKLHNPKSWPCSMR